MKENSFKPSEDLYKTIFRQIDLPLLVLKRINNQYLISDWNPAIIDKFGRNPEDIHGKNILDLFENKKIIEDLNICLEKRFKLSKIRKLWVLNTKETSFQNIKYHFLETDKVLLIFHEMENGFEIGDNLMIKDLLVFQNLIEHVVIQDKEHTILWANKAALDSIDAKLNDIVGKKCFDVWANRFTPCDKCPVEAAINTKDSQIGQQSTYDGRGWFIKGFPIKDSGGNIIGAIEYTINITEWANLENELLNKTKLMHKITETSPVAITLLDLDGNIVFSNKRAEEIFALNKEDVLTRSYNSIEWHITDLDGKPFPDEKLPFRRVLNERKSVYDIKHCIQNAHGEKKYLSLNASPLFNEENELINIVTTIDDITDQIITKKKLKKSEKNYREAYNQIDLYKDIFAHDINNILQNISTSMELLELYSKDKNWSENFHEIIKIIEKQVVRGANLNSNVNILSNIDEEIYEIKPINILKYLKKSINKIKGSMKYNQDIEIVLNQMKNSNNLYVNGNGLIEFLFDNILLNSIIHNKNELISIQINISRKGIKDLEFCSIDFIDNGVGFTEKFKNEISRSSYRYNRFEGIGLGLMLIKKIVESYGGKIEVKNRVDEDHTQGSIFNLVLPCADS